jgi:hypothetical protein
MSAETLEFIDSIDGEAARTHFREFGHVGLTGLITAEDLEPAIADAHRLFAKSKPRALGETVGKLRSMPDPRRQKALYTVLEGIREGAVLLGRDIDPSLDGEEPQVELLDMVRNTHGRAHRDDPNLSDIVAITNLRGTSTLWFEEGDVSYTIDPGNIVIHDLDRNLRHQGFTGSDSERVGLAVAKRQT